MTTPAYTLTNESVSVVWEGKLYTAQKSSPNFLELRRAIIEERWQDIPKHLTIARSLGEWTKGKFTVVEGHVTFDGQELPKEINERLLKMVARGENPTPIFNFYERLLKNPSWRSVKQLWSFLQHQGIPLVEDGCFLAYKSVQHDYTDHHSGKFSNKPGVVNEMPRNQISDDPQVPCHEGFHVGALGYASTFHSDSRIVICKVRPEDVVCVPYDESQQKMRVCRYEVIGVHNGEKLPDTTFIPDDTDRHFDDHSADFDDDIDEGDLEDDSTDESDDGDDHDERAEPEASGKIVDLMHQEADADAVPVEQKRKAVKGYRRFDRMDMRTLMDQSIFDLRQYAGKGLQILGASKIPGGKTALIDRILKVRS